MGLNNLKLSPQLLVSLYPESLVETFAKVIPDTETFKYLGNNQQNISILVSNPSLPYLDDKELQLLTTILSACNLGIADVAIINFNNTNSNAMQNALENLKSKHIFLFGIEPLSIGLPISFPQFQLQQFDNRTYLYSPGLSEISSDKMLKGKLWSCLKALFNL
ncbi:MAG TPA: hypothetical protein VGO09_10200 [Flavisolibacter sp.]|nr:hypothetical protein [Flavisolibacter sp.]